MMVWNRGPVRVQSPERVPDRTTQDLVDAEPVRSHSRLVRVSPGPSFGTGWDLNSLRVVLDVYTFMTGLESCECSVRT